MQQKTDLNEKECVRGRWELRALTGGLVVGATAFLAYKLYVKPWHSIWGATIDEVDREMPGDELIEDPDYITTRAITIDASPEEIFPWLVQMGQGRGGAYTYDRIENMLGLNMHSADRIVPELQFLTVGDFLPIGNKGDGMVVKTLEKDRFLVLDHTDGNWTWAFGLYPTRNGKTRLISRNRISTAGTGVAFRLYMNLIDPGAFVMERKMLLGIKDRVENTGRAAQQTVQVLPKTAAASNV